jgi:hypothetical protein
LLNQKCTTSVPQKKTSAEIVRDGILFSGFCPKTLEKPPCSLPQASCLLLALFGRARNVRFLEQYIKQKNPPKGGLFVLNGAQGRNRTIDTGIFR